MKIVTVLFIVLSSFYFLWPQKLIGYGLPSLNLGLTSFLDGGPLRPAPGFYVLPLLHYYHSNKFVGPQGCELPGIHCPHFNALAVVTQFAYQFDTKILGAHPGIDATISYDLYSHIKKNQLGVTSSGRGFGNLSFGAYLQWEPIMFGQHSIFVHRAEFTFSCPTGKNELPEKAINPGTNFFYINPYWAFTLFFTPRFATSWRLYYLWCAKDHKIGLQAGDAIHGNYTLEYEVAERLWVGLNGYFLQQLHNNRLDGREILHSKEQIFAAGPGFLYIFTENSDFAMFGNLYFENFARNRPQGISAVLRFLKRF